jgi:uncharacterized membrane protein
MFSNLSGWHLVIILFFLLVIVAAIVAAVLIARAVVRRGDSGAGGIDAKLKTLDRLRDRGAVTDAEYQTKRAEILGRL